MKPKRKQKPLLTAKSDQPLKQHSNRPESSQAETKFDPLLALVDSGRDLWASEHADEYVNRLRESWD